MTSTKSLAVVLSLMLFTPFVASAEEATATVTPSPIPLLAESVCKEKMVKMKKLCTGNKPSKACLAEAADYKTKCTIDHNATPHDRQPAPAGH